VHWRLERIAEGLRATLTNKTRERNVEIAADVPYVSFTFDDCPLSAATEGRRILEDCGIRGTFYLAGAFADARDVFQSRMLPDMTAAGHEVGCHTFEHFGLDRCSRALIGEQIRKNQEWLASVLPGYEMTSFAYPMGKTSAMAKRVVGEHYASARGVDSGVNRGRVDLLELKANKVYSYLANETDLVELIDQQREAGGWLIFYTHDVQASPRRYGCTPEMLARVVRAATQDGLEVLPVRSVMDRLGLLRPASGFSV
jgi:peptidoglycan/xylan/chitin deacetylase (PgdA/CDA1 family)